MATASPDHASSPGPKPKPLAAPRAEPHGKWGTTRPSEWVDDDEKIYRVARSSNRLSIINDVEFRRLIKTLEGLTINKRKLLKRDMAALKDLQETALEVAQIYETQIKLRGEERRNGRERIKLLVSRENSNKILNLLFDSRTLPLLNRTPTTHDNPWVTRVFVRTSGAWEDTKAGLDPNVIWIDEFSGQINAVVHSYLATFGLIAVHETARRLMWTLMNTKLLSILAHLLSTGALGCHEVLLLPQTSNWTAHYRGWTSLLNISKHLRQLAEDLDGEPFAGHWQTRFDGVEDLARKTIALILNEDFWLDLRRLCTILRPLAIAASWTQMSSSSSPDRVLLTLRWLAQQYHDMPLRVYSGVHIEGVNFIRSSIDRIWSNCDQDLYLAAFALHPFHRVQAKKKDTELLALVSEEHHIALFTRLYARLMGQNPPAAFLEDVRKWITGHYPNRLADIEKHTRSVQRDAKIKGRYPDAAEIFRRMCPEPLSAFEFFAFRVLSVPAIVPLFTSAKSEAFSTQLYPFVRRGQMSAIIQRTVARSRLGPVLSRAPRLSAVLPAVPGALEDVLLRTNFVPLPKNPGKGMVRLREHLAYRSVTLQRDFGPALEHGFKEEMAWYDLLALGSQPSPFFDLESGDMDFASDAESDDELCDESEPDSSSDGDVWETESESSD